MRRSVNRTRWIALIIIATWAASLTMAVNVYFEAGNRPRRERSLIPQSSSSGGLLAGIRPASNPPPAPSVRQFSTADMFNMLLPLGAVPTELRQDHAFPLRNEDVARFFTDPIAAQQAMANAGRVEGAGVDYQLPGQAPSSARALAISSSAAWYTSVEGAKGVLLDPTMELVIHRFGLNTAEIVLPRVGEESRAFRGYRDIDGPNRAAYLLLFRKENVIGAVVVVMTDHNDDIGELVSLMAKRQYSIIP